MAKMAAVDWTQLPESGFMPVLTNPFPYFHFDRRLSDWGRREGPRLFRASWRHMAYVEYGTMRSRQKSNQLLGFSGCSRSTVCGRLMWYVYIYDVYIYDVYIYVRVRPFVHGHIRTNTVLSSDILDYLALNYEQKVGALRWFSFPFCVRLNQNQQWALARPNSWTPSVFPQSFTLNYTSSYSHKPPPDSVHCLLHENVTLARDTFS